MHHHGRHNSRGRNWFRLLIALLFAINVPLSASVASMIGPDRTERSAPAMSCHEPATANAHDEGPDDEGKSDPAASLQHLCCFTACIPLAASGASAIALALPVGNPPVALLPMRLMPRAIGVDPPPPRA